MNTHRYLDPDYKIVEKKRTQKKILGTLFILIILAVIFFGGIIYIKAGQRSMESKVSVRPGANSINYIEDSWSGYSDLEGFCYF